MPSAVQDFDANRLDDSPCVLDRDGARHEDSHWEQFHSREPYYRPGFHYEDYAPAYCVGYTGFAQYGGCFEDAERSLCANWERIKGDSKLSLDDALPAMRAAWDRMQARMQEQVQQQAQGMVQAQQQRDAQRPLHAQEKPRGRRRGRFAGQSLMGALIQRYLRTSGTRLPAA